MKGSMSEIRPGYWRLRVSLGRDPTTGKPLYRTKAMRATKREAERALAAMVTDVDQGRRALPTNTTVGSLLDQWLEHIEHIGRSPTTLNGYRSIRNQLPAQFLRRPVRKVTPKVLDDLYRHLGEKKGRKPITVVRFHRMLCAAFNQGMRWQLLDRNPAELATPPRTFREEIEIPAVDGFRRVLDAALESRNPENAMIFRMLAATGCRRGELCGMRWSDVDLEAATIRIRRAIVQVKGELIEKDTKGHQQRTVALDDGTVELLRHHRDEQQGTAAFFDVELDPDGFVFSDLPTGATPLPPDRLSQAWRRLADANGVDARLHDLRHLQASILLDAGESIATVAARLGHRDSSTTLRVYAHLMPGSDRRAAGYVGGVLDD